MTLAPIFLLQGRYVRRVTPRLPEPPGPRSGTGGSGRPLRLLIVGDSSAAGVGAASQDEALSGRLTSALAESFEVSWTLVARTGATAAGTVRHLARLTAADFDLAVVSLGPNDVLGRRPLDRWLADMNALAALLRTRFGVRHLLLSGLPPMHALPVLPQPLRWYIGATARRFDLALAGFAAGEPDCEHVPLAATTVAGKLATDGLHPGPPLYAAWSAELARRVRSMLA